MMTTPASDYSRRILALDGVRGLAILVVTLYRFLRESLPDDATGQLVQKVVAAGAWGVDLFFVLSGFLITTVLLQSIGKNNYFSSFYYRRSLRIFPLYFATLFVLLYLLPWITGDNKTFAQASEQQAYLWTYTSNLKMSWENQWCFGYLDHFWSLAVEEQFYLVWPCVVFLFWRRLLWVSLVAMGALALLRAAFCVVTDNGVAPDVFLLFKCDGLLLGAAIAAIWQRDPMLSTVGRLAPVTMTGASLLILIATFNGGRLGELPQVLIAIVWASFLVMVLSQRLPRLRHLMENRTLVTLGTYSYAMYVFQSPLVPLLRPYFSPALLSEWLGNPWLSTLTYVSIMFAITFGLAVVSWHCFEAHFLRLRHSRPVQVPAIAIAAE